MNTKIISILIVLFMILSPMNVSAISVSASELNSGNCFQLYGGDRRVEAVSGNTIYMSTFDNKGNNNELITGSIPASMIVNKITCPVPRGNDGAPGATGAPGKDGSSGVTMTSVTSGLTPYTFVWLFSDGYSYTTPNLRGADGAKGDKGDTGTPGTPAQWRAGTATITSGKNNVTVTMTSNFTNNPTNYRVQATLTTTANWGATYDKMPLVVITGKTPTTFTINVRNVKGATLNAPTSVVFDWIAMPTQ